MTKFVDIDQHARCRHRIGRHRRALQQHAPHAYNQPERDAIIDYDSLEMAIPEPQRPVNELQAIKGGALTAWATLSTAGFTGRLALVFCGMFALLGGPIAYQTFDPAAQMPEFVLAGTMGSLIIVAIVLVRIYLGWSYIGARLLSATIEYEETGWYDGERFVKPPEVLARDRLLGTYEVTPVMRRLKATMASTGGGLLLCGALLTTAIHAGADPDGVYGRGAASVRPSQVLPDGVLYSKGVKSMATLLEDDEAATAEAAAMKGQPGYCGDRYYKAFASGERVCEKFARIQRDKQ